MAYKSTNVLNDLNGGANYQQWNIQQVSPVLSNSTVSKYFSYQILLVIAYF
jgi:hypothetical protein